MASCSKLLLLPLPPRLPHVNINKLTHVTRTDECDPALTRALPTPATALCLEEVRRFPLYCAAQRSWSRAVVIVADEHARPPRTWLAQGRGARSRQRRRIPDGLRFLLLLLLLSIKARPRTRGTNLCAVGRMQGSTVSGQPLPVNYSSAHTSERGIGDGEAVQIDCGLNVRTCHVRCEMCDA
jgi:hypothetical protein